nr:MerR family transcriptional regulator [Paenibacillus glacialis]
MRLDRAFIAPRRVANGYRVYTDDYLLKIKLIKDTKSLGYSLREIQEAHSQLFAIVLYLDE